MKKEKFYKLFNNPAIINIADIKELQEVIKEFPYFQNAHLLLLYGLKIVNSVEYEEQLRQSALYLTSRTVLLDALLNGWPIINKSSDINIETHIPVPIVSIEEKSEQESDLGNQIVAVTEQATTESGAAIDNGESLPTDIKASETIELQEIKPEIKDELPIEIIPDKVEEEAIIDIDNSPNEINNKEEVTSFLLEESQPIMATDKKAEEPDVKPTNNNELLDFESPNEGLEEIPLQENLIESFLKTNPRIVPRLDLNDPRGDISIPSLEENDDFVTETLASIFEQQGLFAKAKDVYEKLILKFPEKSAYFASRIEELNNHIK